MNHTGFSRFPLPPWVTPSAPLGFSNKPRKIHGRNSRSGLYHNSWIQSPDYMLHPADNPPPPPHSIRPMGLSLAFSPERSTYLSCLAASKRAITPIGSPTTQQINRRGIYRAVICNSIPYGPIVSLVVWYSCLALPSSDIPLTFLAGY